MEDVLHSIDQQLEVIAVVRKHRDLQDQGLSRWPVTFIRLQQQENVQVVAHVDEHGERVTNEAVSLITRDGDAIVSGNALSSGSHELSLVVELRQIPPNLQEPLRLDGTVPPTGYALQLAGLSVEPYVRMTTDDLEVVQEALVNAARTVSLALAEQPVPQTPETQPQAAETEEPRNAD
jgi:hypothetical protein